MRCGFSLVEVIVALVLLSVGLTAVAGSGLLAARLLRETELREQIIERSGQLLDSLASERATGTGHVDVAHYTINWTASSEFIRITTELGRGEVFELYAPK